jgi:hypothetical protein
MGERLEPFVTAAEGIGGIDDDLALKASDPPQGIFNRRGRNSKKHNVGAGCIAPVLSKQRYFVSSALPPASKTAADVSFANRGDVHDLDLPIFSVRDCWGCQVA